MNYCSHCLKSTFNKNVMADIMITITEGSVVICLCIKSQIHSSVAETGRRLCKIYSNSSTIQAQLIFLRDKDTIKIQQRYLTSKKWLTEACQTVVILLDFLIISNVFFKNLFDFTSETQNSYKRFQKELNEKKVIVMLKSENYKNRGKICKLRHFKELVLPHFLLS